MIRSGVNLQLEQLTSSQRPSWKHAFDGMGDEPLGVFLASFGHGREPAATGIFSVSEVALVLFLFPRQSNLLGVDHDDEITGVEMRRKDGLVLSAQHGGDSGCQSSQNLTIRINDIPGTLYFVLICVKSLHSNLDIIQILEFI